jgi:hypothetical protein
MLGVIVISPCFVFVKLKLKKSFPETLGVSPTYSHIFPSADCFWVLGLWYAVRRDFFSRRLQDTKGFTGNGADGASPPKGRTGTSALGRHRRVGKIIFLEGVWRNFKKISRVVAGWHPLWSKAATASAMGQRTLGEANATDDTAVVPPGGTCSVRSVESSATPGKGRRLKP